MLRAAAGREISVLLRWADTCPGRHRTPAAHAEALTRLAKRLLGRIAITAHQINANGAADLAQIGMKTSKSISKLATTGGAFFAAARNESEKILPVSLLDSSFQ